MTGHISTPRLTLVPLTLQQLETSISSPSTFEEESGITISHDFFTDRVHRAIRIKVEKMRKAEPSKHAWISYWLIVIKDENIGAGMLGFKGYPDEEGSTEIGYGIDPAYQNKGYMTEAVQALVDWAFTHSFCKVITATNVENPASNRLLEKLGAQVITQTRSSTSWEVRKVLT